MDFLVGRETGVWIELGEVEAGATGLCSNGSGSGDVAIGGWGSEAIEEYGLEKTLG